MAIPADKNPPTNKIKKSSFVASSANAIWNKPPHIAAKAIHIIISCENFISERFASEIDSPGARTIIGISVCSEST